MLKKIRIIAISLLGIVIAIYAIFQTHAYLTGPVIVVYSPANGATYNTPLIEVDGRVQNVSYLSLDGRQIFTDTKGVFSEKLLLSPGYNIIKLEAKDKFGTKRSKQLEIILKEY